MIHQRRRELLPDGLLTHLLRPFHLDSDLDPLVHRSVAATETGLEIERTTRSVLALFERWKISWWEIRSVLAYKTDDWTTDSIWIAIGVEDGRWVSIHESTEGWTELIEALLRWLPGCLTFGDWFEQVAFPAFARNDTLLWSHPGTTAH